MAISQNGVKGSAICDQKATNIIRKGFESKTQNFTFPLYKNLAHPDLDYSWFLSPHLQNVIAKKEKIQRRKL